MNKPDLKDLNISRRNAIKALLASGVLATIPGKASGQTHRIDPDSPLPRYLEGLKRSDGGYAWHGQPVSHLTPTLYVLGSYRALGMDPPDKNELIKWVWENHPQKVRPLSEQRHIFDSQHIQALSWLGQDLSVYQPALEALEKPRGYNKRYEQHGYPFFQAEIKHFKSRELAGLPPPPGRAFTDFLDLRRRENGSFNTTLAKDGGDGNILNTWWGLEALHILNRSHEKRVLLIEWLRSCQLSNGGFTHQPQPVMGGLDDVAYTWAAVRALNLLGAEPFDNKGCIQYLLTLANADGGFSDRPDWLSNPMATYYALDALTVLNQTSLDVIPRRKRMRKKALPSNLKVFSMQIEAHGQGSPQETVALAQALKIHLWGSKNATPGWREKVKELASTDQVPVTFFLADEEYGSWIDIPGMGIYSHIADIMAPAEADIGQSLARQGPVSWDAFRNRRLEPLRKGRGRLNWQFGQHEDVIRLFLDDSLMRPGYSTISTFHFGNIDFTTSEPFLHRWRGQLPFIALQDAHGIEPWWFTDQTEGMRTLFLGTEPTWDAWLKALENNWVAAVRHDYRTKYHTWMHTGSDQVSDFIRNHEKDWRWWDNPSIHRPLVSLVTVRPEDTFEAGRPDQGVNLRIRVAHRNTNHGLLKEPLATFESLAVNGEEVSPELISVASKRTPDSLEDQYRLFSLKSKGTHSATVTARIRQSGELITQKVEFSL